MRSGFNPRREAVAAIAEFKSARVLSGRAREFLDRLKSEDYATAVETIWLTIRRHRREPSDDVSVIKNAVCALNVATTYCQLPKLLDEQRKKCTKAKAALGKDWAEGVIDVLAFARFGGLSVDDNGTITWAQGELPRWLRLSRECATRASKRAMFVRAMSETFCGFFGKPCDAAVAALTDVAFATDKPTTHEQVRAARRPKRHPKNRATHSH
jgi:hypothetical protein